MTSRLFKMGRCVRSAVVLLALVTMRVAVLAASEPQAIRTQDQTVAGVDYLLQGEYVGSLRRTADPDLFGVQVVALGDGAFDAVGYLGGLPGAGWWGGPKLRFRGKRNADGCLLSGTAPTDVLTLSLGEGRIVVRDADQHEIGRLERVVRKSPTLGAKAPPGAIVWFDGTGAAVFRQAHNDRQPEVTTAGFLKLSPGSGGLFVKSPHDSGHLHLEFRLPFEPQGRGQGRANSGCYLQGRYEVQILDSFGLEGRENECGGVYSSHQDPAVNMCLPPLSWQTYDVDFQAAKFDEQGKKVANARLSVRHNGVAVYSDLEIDHTTTAAPENTEVPEPKPLYLQDHGHELWFRNIWWLPTQPGA